jgi:predicted nucleic acid-binding protein
MEPAKVRGCRGDALRCLYQVFDACNLALALRHGAPLITADEHLAKAARSLGCLA